MVDKIGGRKAAACLTGLIVIVGCFLIVKSLPKELVDAVQFLVTTYIAGNVTSDIVEVMGEKARASQSSSSDVESVRASTEEIKKALQDHAQAIMAQDQTIQAIVKKIG